MTEYIFDVPDSNQPIAGDTSLYYPDERDEPMMVREEIVRCRDCEWFKHNSFPRCDLRMQAVEVEPDGYCSWAERRER